jgi:hypothetical protein
MRKLLRLTALVTMLSLALATPTSAQGLDTTGDGSILTGAGGKATFAVWGGIGPDGPTGNLLYVDHDLGLRLKSTSITSFTPGCLSQLTGSGDSTFGPVEFVVAMLDAGEPGTNDAFTIQTSGGYVAGGLLAGGNIQALELGCPP